MTNYKNIENIKKGDKVLSSNGEFVEVLNVETYSSKEKEMTKLIYQLTKTGESMFDNLIQSLEEKTEQLDKEGLMNSTDINDIFKIKRLLENYHILDLETQILTINNVALLNQALDDKIKREECKKIAKELSESLKKRRRGE
jgi:hypothetical protein